MAFSSFSLSLRRLLVVASVLLVLPAFAQKTAPGPPSKTTGVNPPPTAPFPDTEFKTFRPLFISGNVVFQGGASPSEPVAIERICNGLSRREGYTDSKGQFQIEMG